MKPITITRVTLLQGTHIIFQIHVRMILRMWLGMTVLTLFLGLVIAPSGIPYGELGITLGCMIALLVGGILKSIFHKRVIRALNHEKENNEHSPD